MGYVGRVALTGRSAEESDRPQPLQTDPPLPRANRVESGKSYQQA
jgi:hypothetical protein